jgi:glutamate transport system permease protein
VPPQREEAGALEVITENIPRYAEGALVTIELTLLSFALAFVIGLVVAAFRVSPIPPLRLAGRVYTELARNTPLTALMLLAFFALPTLGFRPLYFRFAVAVLAVYTGAFLGEAIRSGINAVGKGQVEAARSLGMGFGQVLGLVVLPQALRTVIPPIANVFIALTKNSSVAYVISVTELTGITRIIANETARPLQAYLGGALGYLLLIIPTGLAFRAYERRVAIRR